MSESPESQTTSDEAIEATVSSLSAKLGAYAETLDDNDRRALDVILYWAADPVDRMAANAPPDLLSAEEQEILRRIENRGR